MGVQGPLHIHLVHTRPPTTKQITIRNMTQARYRGMVASQVRKLKADRMIWRGWMDIAVLSGRDLPTQPMCPQNEGLPFEKAR